ncbi:MAG TPA: hypothetical protein VKX25_13440 [Bryobacteraceae bacterium]|jgi:membrane protein implicated in regulation of membrane protease activity|nr:hypothetical protein [Bryobacteraceae bacterium]
MRWPDIYLLCFAIGTVWSIATVLLGGLHLGHGHAPHVHGAHVHGHGHGAHAHGTHGHTGHQPAGWLAAMVNPNSMAVFLAWFGGVGYILSRHTGLMLWTDLAIAVAFGLAGAWLLASFLRFLQSREKPLDPADYEMVGVLGQVSSPIRPDGVGELIFVRDGARRPVCARSEDGSFIGRGTEVVVTRFEKGVAYVRTWEALVEEPKSRTETRALEQ